MQSSSSTSSAVITYGIPAAAILLTLCFLPRSSNALSLFGIGRKTKLMEATVRRYFEGVNQKDPEMLRSCFGDTATIRDVCGINDTKRTVQSQVLVERCMEFVTAHPDCIVKFHYVRTAYIKV